MDRILTEDEQAFLSEVLTFDEDDYNLWISHIEEDYANGLLDDVA